MADILYLSLTGMTEPLGRSQVLEYLTELSKEHTIYLISFERGDDLLHANEIQSLVDTNDIKWSYLIYSNKYGVFSTLWQIFNAILKGSRIVREKKVDIIHARAMIPAVMGLVLKNLHGVKLIFDIRGFAIDEKLDSGRLKKASVLYKVLKKLDNYLYNAADHIVTLTHEAKLILHTNLSIPEKKITVIPTCASKEVFKPLNQEESNRYKFELGYQVTDKIIIHTGTVSGWYDFEKELLLVKKMMELDNDIKLLILNKKEQEFIYKSIKNTNIDSDRVKVTSAAFDDVHKYLNMSDTSLFFIKPSFSKQASAPTKFAENVACHLPSITNGSVGDMEYYMNAYSVGMVVDLQKFEDDLDAIAKDALQLISKTKDTDHYDKLFHKYFDKEIAIEKYVEIYQSLGTKV